MAVFSHAYYSLYLFDTYSESTKNLEFSETEIYKGNANLRSTFTTTGRVSVLLIR